MRARSAQALKIVLQELLQLAHGISQNGAATYRRRRPGRRPSLWPPTQTFGCLSKGPESADGQEFAAKALGSEVRPGDGAGPPARQAFVVTLL